MPDSRNDNAPACQRRLWLVFIGIFCLKQAKALFRHGDKLSGAAPQRRGYADNQGKIGHMLASLDLAPVRPFYPRSSADFLLSLRLSKANSQHGRTKRLGRQRVIRPASFRPTGPILTLLHRQERRLSLAATTG